MDPVLINILLSALVSAVGVLMLLLYGNHNSRLSNLESMSETKVNVERFIMEVKESQDDHTKRDDAQFKEVQLTIKEFRTEIHAEINQLRTESKENRLEVRSDLVNNRIESNNKLDKLSDQMTKLIGRAT